MENLSTVVSPMEQQIMRTYSMSVFVLSPTMLLENGSKLTVCKDMPIFENDYMSTSRKYTTKGCK